MRQIGGDAGKLRRNNREVVLGFLRSDGQASVAELAAATGLSVATCANIAAQLVGEGAVLELEERESRGGRPARRYAYNPGHFLVAAVNLRREGKKARVDWTLADAVGCVRREGAIEPARSILSSLDETVGELMRGHRRLRAVSLSVPGVVREGIVGVCDIPELSGVDLVRRLKTAHGIEVVADNDMNFAAMGYFRRHAAPDVSGMVYALFPGNVCPGAGVIVNGRLVRGRSNFAGEIAYLPSGGRKKSWPEGRSATRTLKRRIASVVAAMSAAINPDLFVLSGAAAHPDMMPDIRRLAGELVPGEHLPLLAHHRDYGRSIREGMIDAALESVSCGVRLVDMERTWC